MTQTDAKWGPDITPTLIRQIIFLTTGLSLFSALSEPLMQNLFALPGLSYLLGLSWEGLGKYWLWQIVTFLFIEDTGGQGPTFSMIIRLVFNMYFLWVMGSDVLARVGQKSFILFYLITGIITGLVTLWVMHLTGRPWGILAGASPSVLALLSAWVLFNPNVSLLFFFILPVQAKWLWLLAFSSYVLVYLVHFDWVQLTFTGLPFIIGYIYAVIAWDLPAPFDALKPLHSFLGGIGKLFKVRVKKEKGKIFDFKTGETVLDDNQFVDAMLEKISRNGESSLTWKERQRLQAISKAKQKR